MRASTTTAPGRLILGKTSEATVHCLDDPASCQPVNRLAARLKACSNWYEDPQISHQKIAAEINNVLTSK